jgi:radical SAM superfamily enzyme YgiQ (UPF0313 family)
VQEKYNDIGWRPLPVDYIMKELIYLSQSGIKSPYFTDEDFFGMDYNRSKSLAKSICDAKESGLLTQEMNFFISARVNDVVSSEGKETLALWQKAGLREIFIGLESGIPMQLKRYGKAATPDKNKEAIAVIKDFGFQLDIGYILFDPEMSFRELLESTNYLKELNLSRHDSRSLKKLRVQPLTKMASRYQKLKLIKGNLHINNLDYPVEYKDEKVIETMNLFTDWESNQLCAVYTRSSSFLLRHTSYR